MSPRILMTWPGVTPMNKRSNPVPITYPDGGRKAGVKQPAIGPRPPEDTQIASGPDLKSSAALP